MGAPEEIKGWKSWLRWEFFGDKDIEYWGLSDHWDGY